ncbi:transposase, partial [Sporosarcina sp. OR05]|uniref:transposase n=1 Tax=Sporosarcina sp. OR05 TaxID=2969819 RepID=UPI00352B9021
DYGKYVDIYNMRNLNDHSPQLTEQDTKIAALEEELLCLKAIIARYEEMFRLQKQRQFGASSEKFPSGQLTLFGEETSHSSTLENTTVQGTSKAYN